MASSLLTRNIVYGELSPQAGHQAAIPTPLVPGISLHGPMNPWTSSIELGKDSRVFALDGTRYLYMSIWLFLFLLPRASRSPIPFFFLPTLAWSTIPRPDLDNPLSGLRLLSPVGESPLDWLAWLTWEIVMPFF